MKAIMDATGEQRQQMHMPVDGKISYVMKDDDSKQKEKKECTQMNNKK
jgi:hypothetical protein